MVIVRTLRKPLDSVVGNKLMYVTSYEHIVFECRTHEEYGDIIDEGAPDHQLATLFGTKTGIDASAEFVRKSKAFQKTQTTEIP